MLFFVLNLIIFYNNFYIVNDIHLKFKSLNKNKKYYNTFSILKSEYDGDDAYINLFE